MKSTTNNSDQTCKSKRIIKINILYIIAFQLVGLGSALFLEYKPFETNCSQIDFASEKITTETDDLVNYQNCTLEKCDSFGP